MGFNGSGVFISSTLGIPVVTGTTISSTVQNNWQGELDSGLSSTICKDGQTTTTARITFAAGINSSLATDTTSGGTGSIYTAGGIGITKSLYVGEVVTVAGGSEAIRLDNTSTGSPTGVNFLHILNQSGELVVGVDNGTGDGTFFNSTAFAGCIGTANATALNLATNLTTRLSIDANGTTTVTATNASTVAFQKNTGSIYWNGTPGTDQFLHIKGTSEDGLIQQDGSDVLMLIDWNSGQKGLRIDLNTGNVAVSNNGTNPTASAALSITSTTGALLLPRMTTTEKAALTPVNGMVVYDSTLGKVQGYQAGNWISFA